MHKETYESHDPHFLEAPSVTTNKGQTEDDGGKSLNSWKSLLINWPLMSSIIIYCVFSLHDMAYTEIFSLWAVSPGSFGGLSFSTQDVGAVLSVTGLGLFIYQLSIYHYVERWLGAVTVCRVAAALSILTLACYPSIASLHGTILTLALNAASIIKNIMSASIITGCFILQNRAVEQHQRGAANGIAMTSMSIFKAIGPAGGGAIFSMGQKRVHAAFLPGNQLVFFVLNMVELIGLVLTFKPFLAY
uniref:Uncharacterized protein n=1 Tax=Kalanchoe fedtschenkoi TaxID=63787 RepID=A0A7N0U5N7_KALFE